MKRRNFIWGSTLTIGGLSLINNGFAKIMMDNTNNHIKMLSPELGVFTEKGGTIAFLKSKSGLVIVDAQFPDTAQHLISELKEKYPNSTWPLLINTHHHGDHTSGNIAFKGLVKHVVAHENSLINQKNVAEKAGKTADNLFPDQTFKNDWNYKIDNHVIKAYYFGAGHTNGDALIHFENQNIVHIGDLVFNRKFPFIDKTAGANVKSWISVLDKTLATFDANTQFVFGHALDPKKIVGTTADVKAFQNYLEKLLEYVAKEKKAGKSLEEINKIKVIPGAEEWEGEGIERSISAAYQEV